MKRHFLACLCLLAFLYSHAKDSSTHSFKKQGLYFLENNGQLKDEQGRTRSDIDFLVKGDGVDVFIGDGKIAYQWRRSLEGGEKAEILKMTMELAGANKMVQAAATGKEPFTTRFCIDKNTITAYAWQRVLYKDVYPGIDWELYIKDGKLEYDFIVHEGADASVIQLLYDGDVKLRKEMDGSILATTRLGTVRQRKPYSYAENGQEVASSYSLKRNRVSFKVAPYSGTLVIDPVLVWGTYYGDSQFDEYNAIATDNLGNIYAAGFTVSPTGISTNNTTFQGNGDVMVSKFDLDGNLVWTTYCGTPGNDKVFSIAVDGGNGVYVIGACDTVGNSGNWDVYIAKIDTAGDLLHTRFMGGPQEDRGYGISPDSSGNVYVCGFTGGWMENTLGCYQPAFGGGQDDAFVARLDSQLTTQWCTYYGGNNRDAMLRLAAQPFGGLYVAGATESTNGIATLGTSQTAYGGGMDAVVARFDATTGMLSWGTYLGGAQLEEAIGVGFDGVGSVYICGHTGSATGIATTGAYQDSWSGQQDGFVAKYNSSGVVQWSTYYGGSGGEVLFDLRMTSHDVVVAGYSGSNDMDVSYGFQQVNNGSTDGVVAKYNKNTGTLSWGTYYGGGGDDMLQGITTDLDDNIYVAGGTTSTANISLNTTVQASNAGGLDGFIARIDDCDLLAQPTAITGDDTICAGSTNTYSIAQIPFASLYIWTVPTGWAGSSFSESITLTANSTGGPVTVYAYNGCDTTAVISLNIVVTPLPTVSISQSGNVLTASGTFTSYQWYLNGSPISGATGQSHTATQGGSYYVIVADANGCSGQSTALPVGVGALTTEEGVAVYPNPTHGIFAVKGNFASANGKLTLAVLDIRGVKVHEEEIETAKGMIDSQVHLSESIAPGIYVVRISSDVESRSMLLRIE